jgi:hypothetical protein
VAVAWTKRQKVITGAIAGAALLVGGAVMALNLPVSSSSAQLNFSATFDTAADLNLFDFGYSGLIAPQNGIPTSSLSFAGDHDTSSTSSTTCGAPTTFRNVTIGGTPQALDFSQLFYWCAPSVGGGHMMSVQSTLGYNIAWFSPKGYLTDVSKVCWDINETAMSRRKWTQVLFVSPADATRYPVGTSHPVAGGVPSNARGTGGFDLGYTAPDFRDPGGPSTGIFPQGGTLAGFRDIDGTASFFDHEDVWGSQFVGPGPPYDGTREQTADKMVRYTHCLEQTGTNTDVRR